MAQLTRDLLAIDGIRYEPTPRRIRGMLGATAAVDSHDAVLVWTPGAYVPEWAFPEADIDLAVIADAALTRYEDPDLVGRVTVAWDALDRWLVEEEPVIGHPRDPHTRVDVHRSAELVEVHLDGELLARSTRSRLLFETGLGVRHYLPASDIRTELFTPSDTRSVCPYKGEAIYRSIRIGDTVHPDLVWSYPAPLHDAEPVRDLWSFWDEKVEVTVTR